MKKKQTCGRTTKLFGGKTCELIAGHHAAGKQRVEHRSGSVTWFDVSPEDGRVV